MSDVREPESTRKLPPLRVIVAVVIGILLIWFALVNRDPVEINYIIFTRDSRLIYIIIGAALLGAIAGALLRQRRERRARRERHRDR